jgi:hypothetical protein
MHSKISTIYDTLVVSQVAVDLVEIIEFVSDRICVLLISQVNSHAFESPSDCKVCSVTHFLPLKTFYSTLLRRNGLIYFVKRSFWFLEESLVTKQNIFVLIMRSLFAFSLRSSVTGFRLVPVHAVAVMILFISGQLVPEIDHQKKT